jgi:hypothetical protein
MDLQDVSAWLRTATFYLLIVLLVLLGLWTIVKRRQPYYYDNPQGQMLWEQHRVKGKKA